MTSIREATVLEVAESTFSGGIRREISLHTNGHAAPTRIHYDIFGGTGEIAAFDGFVHGILFHIMEMGQPVYVRGPMTETALYNLDDYQRAWAKWRPERYKVVDIVPDTIISPPERQTDGAIVAFSGGIDSNFTLVRNKMRIAGGVHDIRSAVLVQGFDVDYSDDEGLRGLIERCKPVLDMFEVDLKIVRTNSKALRLQYWQDSHAAELSACLHQFSSAYDTALVGSSPPYEAMNLPWGSNPVTDPRLSTGVMTIIHDGAGFNRTEKIAVLSPYPSVVERLKVCWEGPAADSNCGVCEKCIRTRLCFAAVGNTNPGCFPGPFDPELIKRWRPGGARLFSELQLMIAHMNRNNMPEPWIPTLKRKMRQERARMRLVQFLQDAGLKEPLRKALSRLGMRPTVPHIPTAPDIEDTVDGQPETSGTPGR